MNLYRSRDPRKRVIHTQRFDGRPASRSKSATHSGRVHRKMFRPFLPERMKQFDDLAINRIYNYYFIRFVQTAMRALKHEVRFFCKPAFALRDDVIDMKDSPLPDLE